MLASLLGLVAGICLGCELFLRLAVAGRARRLAVLVKTIWSRLASRQISDHWKEQASLIYARKLLGESLILAAFTWLSLAPVLIGLLFAAGSAEQLFAYAMRPEILLGSLLLSVIYLRARSRA